MRISYLTAALSLLLALSSCTVPVKTGPNIVYLMTDDQPAELTAVMPNVQRLLAAQGVTFSSAFATTSLCCPARTTVLRGQYVHNHTVYSNGGPQGGFPKFYQTGYEASTLATWLQDKGYETALMGKYLNSYPFGPPEDNPPNYREPRRSYIPPGWNEWFGFFDAPDNRPYQMYNYRVNEGGRAVWYGSKASDYQTDVLSDQAVNFIQRNRRSSKPFFLYLAPTAPHLPVIPAERHKDKLLGLQVPRSPAFNEADVSDKPRWVRERLPMNAAQIAGEDETYRKQAEMLLAVDEMVGRLIDTLAAAGELQNTYIVFTSDQGFHSGEHRLMRMKLTPYAAASQIPLIIRGPGIPTGQTKGELVLNTDLAPTLAGLVGANVPAFVDGRSLKPLWDGGNSADSAAVPWRQTVGTEFWPRSVLEENYPIGPVPKYRAVRSKRHLFVEYSYQDGTQEGELYDLQNDPFELDNLYSRTDPGVLKAYSDHAARLQACAAETCREAEDESPEGL